MKVTIKEVAKMVGVSPSTVSRVISDSPRISEETKKLVREAMHNLDYHPNAIARSLVNKSTKTIGIVMPQSTERAFLNPFFPQALSGITSAAHKENYCLLLSTGNDEDEQLDSITNIVMGGRVDGVIIMYSSVDSNMLNFLAETNIPCLIIGKPLENVNILYVDNDNVEAAFKVTEKLIANGHSRIGFLGGPFKFIMTLDRLDGYRNALLKNNLIFDKKYIVESEFTKNDGYNSMKELLANSDKPTAVVVTDDVMAFGAIEAIKEKGMKIPQDIEIMSFNNVPLAEFCSPSLTSVDIDAYKLGYESGKLIIQKIKGKSNKDKVIVPTKIIYRESSINK